MGICHNWRRAGNGNLYRFKSKQPCEDIEAFKEFTTVLNSLYEYLYYLAWAAVAVFLGMLFLCRGSIPNSLIMYSWFNLVALVQISVASMKAIETVGMALNSFASNNVYVISCLLLLLCAL